MISDDMLIVVVMLKFLEFFAKYLKGTWGVAKMITGSSQNWLHLWQYLI